MRAFLLSLLLVSIPAIAYADAMPSCPPGTHLQTNPGSNGHHGGGQCISNPSRGGCAIGVADADVSAIFLLAAALALVARRRAK
jgi:hypothetical protein